jgi:hypothetical protein
MMIHVERLSVADGHSREPKRGKPQPAPPSSPRVQGTTTNGARMDGMRGHGGKNAARHGMTREPSPAAGRKARPQPPSTARDNVKTLTDENR